MAKNVTRKIRLESVWDHSLRSISHVKEDALSHGVRETPTGIFKEREGVYLVLETAWGCGNQLGN